VATAILLAGPFVDATGSILPVAAMPTVQLWASCREIGEVELPMRCDWLVEPAYDRKWSADDTKHGCVVDKIIEFRKVVGEKSKSVEERRFALRFLLHCVQDMHQPCHVGDNHDRGGRYASAMV
jgi:hypothetical protein